MQYLPFLPRQWPWQTFPFADQRPYSVQTPSDIGSAAERETSRGRLAYPLQGPSAADTDSNMNNSQLHRVQSKTSKLQTPKCKSG